MVEQSKTEGPTRTCPEADEVLYRGVRPFTVAYKGRLITVALHGWHPVEEGDGVLVGAYLAATDQALRDLKERVDGLPSGSLIAKPRLISFGLEALLKN